MMGWAHRVFAIILLMLPSLGLARTEHEGPAGLKWGKSPADARSILAARFKFVDETAAQEDRFNTIDQRYTGQFGDLEAAEIRLKFHKGEFFYLAVILATSAENLPAQIYSEIVQKMRDVDGKPKRQRQPPPLMSSQASIEHLPLEGEDKSRVLALLAGSGGKEAQQENYKLLDLLVRTGLWDPFAEWKYKNKVTVQTFLHTTRQGEQAVGPLVPVWIFLKDDRFADWQREVKTSEVIMPRDY